jgi:hypothetical protein
MGENTARLRAIKGGLDMPKQGMGSHQSGLMEKVVLKSIEKEELDTGQYDALRESYIRIQAKLDCTEALCKSNK